MPPKRTVMDKTGSKDISELKRTRSRSQQLSESNKSEISPSDEEKYLLQREKSSLLSKLKKIKKDLSDVRATIKDLEFKALQDPQRKEDKYSELMKNVDLWVETLGISLDQVTYTNNEKREWVLQGAVDGVQFSINILCEKDEKTQKGFVKNFFIECSEPCKQELQPFLNNIEGNIEQVLKLLKVYSEFNKTRESGLNDCKKEFGDVISISCEPSGETVVELGTEDAYYFQIKWKLSPSSRHFAKIKNVCRIACTKDGDKYIKANTDLPTIKKGLSQSPLDVIKMLAKGLVNLTEENAGIATDAEKGER